MSGFILLLIELNLDSISMAYIRSTAQSENLLKLILTAHISAWGPGGRITGADRKYRSIDGGLGQ